MGSWSSLCFSVASVVKSSRSACEREGWGRFVRDWYSQSARRQDIKGVTALFRRREESWKGGKGDELARTMGE